MQRTVSGCHTGGGLTAVILVFIKAAVNTENPGKEPVVRFWSTFQISVLVVWGMLNTTLTRLKFTLSDSPNKQVEC